MTTTISSDYYCTLTPQEQASVPNITPTTKKYWSQYCKLKKELANAPMPSHKTLWEGGEDAFNGMISGLLKPKSLEFLGAIEGTKILYKTIKRAVGKMIKDGLSPEIREAAEKFIQEGGDAAVANAASISGELIDSAEYVSVEVAEKAGYEAGDMLLADLFALFDGLGELLAFAMVVQMIGMIFDTWDPCDLNSQLTADELKTFTTSFNDQFRLAILGQVGATNDSYGRTILNGVWPVEYYLDQSILKSHKQKEYKKVYQQLSLQYLNNLQFNACGKEIPKIPGGNLISNDIIQGFDKDALVFFSDGNTVAANWLYKWWPLILGIIIVLIVLFLVLKKRQTP